MGDHSSIAWTRLLEIIEAQRDATDDRPGGCLGVGTRPVSSDVVRRLAEAGLVECGVLAVSATGVLAMVVVPCSRRIEIERARRPGTLADDEAAVLDALARGAEIRGPVWVALGGERWWRRRWWIGAFIPPVTCDAADALIAHGLVALRSSVERGRIMAQSLALRMEVP